TNKGNALDYFGHFADKRATKWPSGICRPISSPSDQGRIPPPHSGKESEHIDLLDSWKKEIGVGWAERMNPSLPVPSSTLSIWHRTTRSFPLLHANRTAEVPASTKYLIIGSGISGALTAWKLVESGTKPEDIVILEAREAVSGASGRNAGHIRPDSFRGFPGYAAVHGPEQAKKILANERVVLEKVHEFVEANHVDSEFRFTNTFEVGLSEKFVERLADSLAALQAAGGATSHIKFYQGKEAKARTRVPNALCAYEWRAGTNHPGKLVQWILNDFVSKGGKLWTHCPATNIAKARSSNTAGHRWEVHTPRGIVATESVIHCTNAYAAYLVPELREFITPRRSQVQSFIPRLSLSGEDALKHTMALSYGAEEFFSVNSLRDGTIVLGGTGTRDASDLPDGLITFDDTEFSEHIARNSTREFTQLSQEPDNVPLRHGEGLDHAWTGILAMTADRVPLVGHIEGLEGQWICAGFNGHGMAKVFTCAPGLVKLINGHSWKETGLPECFRFSRARIHKSVNPQVRSS
ncbi:FAD dependent oxidoreductase, partial [Penicillium hispanicum]|uniref:FAD dependent oxidoreductase n=1 Tax=Penicillium hispanicum TaxID=1080232 RepID=UPI0025418818